MRESSRAASLGLDPDRWFDNVEEAMRLLSKRAYHRKTRHGYVRGHEVVKYVREIRERVPVLPAGHRCPGAVLTGARRFGCRPAVSGPVTEGLVFRKTGARRFGCRPAVPVRSSCVAGGFQYERGSPSTCSAM